MAATLIDLREPRQSADDLPGLRAVLLQLLVGEPFLFAATGYADEFFLHFGKITEYTLPRYGKRAEGTHTLSLRGSAWAMKSGAWPLAVSAGMYPAGMPEAFGKPVSADDLTPGVLVEDGAVVLAAAPFEFRPNQAFGLQLYLSDGSQLTVVPTPAEAGAEGVADWQLIGPHGSLVVGPGPRWVYQPTAPASKSA